MGPRATLAPRNRGLALCPSRCVRQPANQETCISCGRVQTVSLRTPDGPLCQACRPWKTLTCTICGKTGPCMISKATGQPCCPARKQRWVRSTGCGQVRPTRGGTIAEPLCAICTRPDPAFWRTCPGCGEIGRTQIGRNTRRYRCTVLQQLRDVLADQHGNIRPDMQLLQQTPGHDRPA